MKPWQRTVCLGELHQYVWTELDSAKNITKNTKNINKSYYLQLKVLWDQCGHIIFYIRQRWNSYWQQFSTNGTAVSYLKLPSSNWKKFVNWEPASYGSCPFANIASVNLAQMTDRLTDWLTNGPTDWPTLWLSSLNIVLHASFPCFYLTKMPVVLIYPAWSLCRKDFNVSNETALPEE